MKFIIETQEYSDGSASVVTPIVSKVNAAEAESEFCRVRSIAAISSVPVHSVFLIDSTEGCLDYRVYNHISGGVKP